MLDYLHEGKTVLVIDLEFSSVSKGKNEIIEVAMVKYKNYKTANEKVFEFNSLYGVNHGINKYVTKMTGITEESVKGLMTFKDSSKEFSDFVEDVDIFVGHNISSDFRVLRKNGIKISNVKVFDTMKMYKRMYNDTSDLCNLEHVSKKLNIGNFEFHNAMEDVKATSFIYEEMTSLDNMTLLSMMKSYRKEAKSGFTYMVR